MTLYPNHGRPHLRVLKNRIEHLELYQRALAKAVDRPETDAGVVGEPMMVAVAHSQRVSAMEAEIERLQGELFEAKSIINEQRERLVQAGLEIERLRAALQEIRFEMGESRLSVNFGQHHTIADRIARHALEGKK
jgi:capsule polysaccharide export protein KpsE/RkpR